jgi:hypothetical protein
MPASTTDVVVWGIARSGRSFRPSDWADRLAGVTSAFCQARRLSYSPLVQPVTVQGVRALVVGSELATLEPRLHRFLLDFARDNELVVVQQAGALADPGALVPPLVAMAEPREPV